MELPDEELLHHYRHTKSMSVLGDLYHRYIPLVYGLSLKYLGDKHAAQDAVMDIFESLTDKLSKYEVKNFKTWLYSVAKNHCLMNLRKESKNIFVEIEDSVVENDDFFTLIDKPESQKEADALAHCLTTLPDVQRRSVHYFYLEEKSYADIVEITGFTLNNVKSYIQNGKRNLKSCILKVMNYEA